MHTAPVMIRSRRDIVLPWLWWVVSATVIASVGCLAAGAPAAAGGLLTASLISLSVALLVQRRSTATLWLDRVSLKSSLLRGRIEIDSHETRWRLAVRREGEILFDSATSASHRGGTAVIEVEVPVTAEAGERVSLELRGSGGTGARFSMIFTG